MNGKTRSYRNNIGDCRTDVEFILYVVRYGIFKIPDDFVVGDRDVYCII